MSISRLVSSVWGRVRVLGLWVSIFPERGSWASGLFFASLDRSATVFVCWMCPGPVALAGVRPPRRALWNRRCCSRATSAPRNEPSARCSRLELACGAGRRQASRRQAAAAATRAPSLPRAPPPPQTHRDNVARVIRTPYSSRAARRALSGTPSRSARRAMWRIEPSGTPRRAGRQAGAEPRAERGGAQSQAAHRAERHTAR